jgi:hypothetical protein
VIGAAMTLRCAASMRPVIGEVRGGKGLEMRRVA